MRTGTRIASTSIAIAATAAISVLGTAGPASAAGGASLRVADTTVHPGQKVAVSATCATGDGLNLIGSHAFRATGNDGPYTGNGGTAKITSQQGGTYHGYAVISTKAKPGKYQVNERCGGGTAGAQTITVS